MFFSQVDLFVPSALKLRWKLKTFYSKKKKKKKKKNVFKYFSPKTMH